MSCSPNRLEQLKERRALYLVAEQTVLTGQEYAISDGVINRRVRRADLEQLREQIREFDDEIQRLEAQSAGRRRPLYIR